MVNLMELPDDVLLEIFSYFDRLSDRSTLAKVNRRFARISKEKYWRKKIYVSYEDIKDVLNYEKNSREELLYLLKKRCHSMKEKIRNYHCRGLENHCGGDENHCGGDENHCRGDENHYRGKEVHCIEVENNLLVQEARRSINLEELHIERKPNSNPVTLTFYYDLILILNKVIQICPKIRILNCNHLIEDDVSGRNPLFPTESERASQIESYRLDYDPFRSVQYSEKNFKVLKQLITKVRNRVTSFAGCSIISPDCVDFEISGHQGIFKCSLKA